jgi:Cft2 family RNA processing exonuclease
MSVQWSNLQLEHPDSPCALLEYDGIKILLECCLAVQIEPFQLVLPQEIEWSTVDCIIISSYEFASALPYITEYTGFSGQIFATPPTIELARLGLIEHVTLLEQMEGSRLIFDLFDIQNCISKIEAVYFMEPKVVLGAEMRATNSGTHLGATNWIINIHDLNIYYISGWNRTTNTYLKSIDLNPASDANLILISSRVHNRIESTQKEPFLASIWPTLEKELSSGCHVLFPISPFDDLFELIAQAHACVGSSKSNYTFLHCVSPIVKNTLLFSNICSEWMHENTQNLTMSAKQVLIHGELLSQKKLITHTGLDTISVESPSIMFCSDKNLCYGPAFDLLNTGDLNVLLVVPSEHAIPPRFATLPCIKYFKAQAGTPKQLTMLLREICSPETEIKSLLKNDGVSFESKFRRCTVDPQVFSIKIACKSTFV